MFFQLSALQSLDHAEYSYDAKSKQTTAKTSTTFQQKQNLPTEDINRRYARLITNVPTEHEHEISTTTSNTNSTNNTNTSHKLFSFESFDDSIRRFQRLREIRKNLRTKYDDQTKPEETTQTINVPIERITPTDPNIVELNDQTTDKNKINDRKHRSRTLETNQIRSVDNQIYSTTTTTTSTKSKQQPQHRSESHQHRTNRISFRRSSEDIQDKQLQLKRHLNSTNINGNETWLEIGQEHWTNLLENGWRPNIDTPGVNLVSFNDSGKTKMKGKKRKKLDFFVLFLDDHESRKRKQNNEDIPPVIDLYEQIQRNEYISLFEQLDFAYARTIDLGNEFWRFLEIYGNQHLCLYHQLNKQFIMYRPDNSLLSFPWPYDGIVDISWSKPTNRWVVATQTQIVNLLFFRIKRLNWVFFSVSFRLFAIVHLAKFYNQLISMVIGLNVLHHVVHLSFIHIKFLQLP